MKNYNLIIINLLFCIFPISFVLGNLAININSLLIIFYTLFLYTKKILNFKFNIYDKLLFSFFFFILISLVINIFDQLIFNKIISTTVYLKTLFFFKYLFLYLVLRFLISKKIINLKLFNYVCAACASFIITDVLIQFIFGRNIIGMEPFSSRHYSSFFGNELIAGGYLQKFSLFIFFLPFFSKIKSNSKILIQLFAFLIILIAIILTGNRMPLILFLFSVSVFLIFDIKTRKYLIPFFLITFFSLLIIFNKYENFKIHSLNTFKSIKTLSSTFFDSNLISKPLVVWQEPYVTEFYCGKEAMKENPIIGGGIRFYRTFMDNCNSHPHNYFIEIISDLGIIGLGLILIFVYSLLFKILKNYYLTSKYKKQYFEKVSPFFLILLCEFFPLRTSGSFFTTNNATLIFIIFAILVSYCKKNNKIL